jgi:hypothetical protein
MAGNRKNQIHEHMGSLCLRFNLIAMIFIDAMQHRQVLADGQPVGHGCDAIILKDH